MPFSASIAREGEQGRVVSTVMSGLLIGILVSRVVAGLVAEVVGWRGVFVLGAALTAVAVVALWRTLPVVAPSTSLPYPRLLLSVLRLIRDEPVLRFRDGARGVRLRVVRRAVDQRRVPAGRVAVRALGSEDRALRAVRRGRGGRRAVRGPARRPRPAFGATGAFLALVALSWIPLGLGAFSLVALAIGLVVFDLGVQGSHISNQNTIYALHPEARSRLNTAYMTSYFLGGAAGSGLSSALYASHGWAGVSIVGAAFPTAGFLLWLVVVVRGRRRRAVADRRAATNV